MNYLHLDGISYRGCPDISADKLVLLGNVLKEIYEAKLKWNFPERACTVEFFIPEDPEDFSQYQLSFWQTAHEE